VEPASPGPSGSSDAIAPATALQPPPLESQRSH
jgi:hypothetical protein